MRKHPTKNKIGVGSVNVDAAIKKQMEEAAYCKWAARGFLTGNDVNDWLEAEREVLNSLKKDVRS
jgi:hypothetical protein